MKKDKIEFKLTDIFYIFMAVFPIASAMAVRVLTKAPSEGISISGAQIYFEILLPFGHLPISEVQLNLLCVSLSVIFAGLYLAHGVKERYGSKRQLIAEWIVETADKLTIENMGVYFAKFSPFVIVLFALSLFSSLTSLIGLFPPTADINTVGAWAILIFVLITYVRFKAGLTGYLRSFTKPAAFLAPINIISELATPVSMAFRHFGNILSGSVIMTLIYFALSKLSRILLSPISGYIADIPLFSVGIPAIFSAYFDLFSAVLQAFIFVMLSMLNISGALPENESER